MKTYKVKLTRRRVIQEGAAVNVMARDQEEALKLALDVGRNEEDVAWSSTGEPDDSLFVMWKDVEEM